MGDEIRVKISDKLDKVIGHIAESMGVKKTEYVKGLIMNDLRKRGGIS